LVYRVTICNLQSAIIHRGPGGADRVGHRRADREPKLCEIAHDRLGHRRFAAEQMGQPGDV